MNKVHKLKVLCLQGQQLNKPSFEFLTQNFRQTFSDLIDFHFVEAPFVCEPQQQLLDLGFQAPFYSWFDYILPHSDKYTNVEKEIGGTKESTEKFLKAWQENGPFDGVLGFSQGSLAFRAVYQYIKWIKPQDFEHIALPKFMISISGPLFPGVKLIIDGKSYNQTEFKFPLPSIHIYGKKDPFFEYIKLECDQFESPQHLVHEQGHRIPKLSEIDKATMVEFLQNQLEAINAQNCLKQKDS